MDLTAWHWGFAVGWTIFMAYSEGYRGFQLRFSPTVVARAWHLAEGGRPHQLLLAPAFCMGFFHASRRRLLTSWILTAAIISLIIGIRFLAQPWRGLIDLGVVVGLLWGSISIVIFAVLATQRPITTDPQLPS